MPYRRDPDGGWRLPDQIEGHDLVCLSIPVPNDPHHRAALWGALTMLTDWWNWQRESYPNERAHAAAAYWLELLTPLMVRDTCTADIAPYWDDPAAADADDTEPALNDFPWYENLADFAVTSFLATTVTPGAAIAITTTVRRGRLLFRRRDWGALVKVFIDGILQTEVDTYSASPDVIAYDYTAPLPAGGGGGVEGEILTFAAQDAPPTWNIRIEHSGTANPLAITAPGGGYAMEVIRKRLYEAEVEEVPPQMRVLNDQLQYSPDSGATWTDLYDLLTLQGAQGIQGTQGIQGVPGAPGADGQDGINGQDGAQGAPGNGFPPAPDTSTDVDAEICGGALYLVNYLDEKLEDVLTVVDAGGSLTSMVGNFMDTWGGKTGALIDKVTEVITSVLSLTTSVIRAFRTVEAVEEVQSALYCAIKNNPAGFTPDLLHSWRDGLGNQTWKSALLGVSRFISDLEHQDRYYIGTLDPSTTCAAQFECDPSEDWCYRWSVTNGLLPNWTITQGAYSNGIKPATVYVGGNQNRPRRQLIVEFAFSQSTITRVTIEYTRTLGNQSSVSNDAIWAGASYQNELENHVPSSTGNPFEWTGQQLSNTLIVMMSVSGTDSGGDPGGDMTISAIEIAGIGVNPVGADNCE